MHGTSETLIDKYRPRTLSEIRGQDGVVRTLAKFLESPYATAFIFEGETGVGKTSAALALARDLGVPVDQKEIGGLYQIPSGEQTGETVRTTEIEEAFTQGKTYGQIARACGVSWQLIMCGLKKRMAHVG